MVPSQLHAKCHYAEHNKNNKCKKEITEPEKQEGEVVNEKEKTTTTESTEKESTPSTE